MVQYFGGWIWVANIIEKYLKGTGIDIGPCNWPWPGSTPVDVHPGVCENIRKLGFENVINASGDKLDMVEDGTQDYVLSSHSIEHIKNYPAALNEWLRVLKPGGYLVLYMPHPDNEAWRVGGKMSSHVNNCSFDMVYDVVKNKVDLIYGTNKSDDHYGFLFIAQKV